ncbi:MAG TPA: ABC transporter permease, partial [Thermoplasmata archaeon]|nr:ABC transporter permease [Thermoplasmata archaeon]
MPAVAVLVLAAIVAVLALRKPMLARMAGRNLARRKGRVAIAVLGLLVGTAIVSSSLVVGDTLNHIFVQNVYDRLDLVDETVSKEVDRNLLSFNESVVPALQAGLVARGAPIDGLAPALVKRMPIRNPNGSQGSQDVTVMGLDDAQEAGFGDLVRPDGSPVRLSALPPQSVVVNERAKGLLNASRDDILTLFYGTTNQTIVYRRVEAIVGDVGKGNWDLRPIVFMDLRDAQSSFGETARVNLVRISNVGGVADGAAVSDRVTRDAILVIAANRWDLAVSPVKADGLDSARALGRDATELFLVMGAFSVVAGLLLIVNIFVMMAEERKAEMCVSRAIGLQRTDLTTAFLLEGSAFAFAAAALGALAGLALGYVMIYFFAILVPLENGVRVEFYFDPISVLVAFAAGAVMTFASVALAAWRISRLNVVRAVRDLKEPEGHHATLYLTAGIALAVLGVAGVVYGFLSDYSLGKVAGVPLLALGLAVAASRWVPARWPVTAAGLANLTWQLGPWHFVNVRQDEESVLFVAIGLLLVLGGILVAVFNAGPALKGLLVAVSRRKGRPAARIAMSYPTERPFRTGMTLAMFALILFTVTVITMVQAIQGASVQRFIEDQSGGYDIVGFTGTYGEIPEFRRILWENFSRPSMETYFLEGNGSVASATVLPAKVNLVNSTDRFDYTLWGIDNFLVNSNQYGFHEHLPWILDRNGTRVNLVDTNPETERRAVWNALSVNHSYAVVDRSVTGPNQFVGPGGGLRAVPGDAVIVSDGEGREVRLIILGVLEQALQFTSGIFADHAVVTDTFNVSRTYTAYFFQLAPGIEAKWMRGELERIFFVYGLRTIDIREEIGRAFDASQQVLTL